MIMKNSILFATVPFTALLSGREKKGTGKGRKGGGGGGGRAKSAEA